MTSLTNYVLECSSFTYTVTTGKQRAGNPYFKLNTDTWVLTQHVHTLTLSLTYFSLLLWDKTPTFGVSSQAAVATVLIVRALVHPVTSAVAQGTLGDHLTGVLTVVSVTTVFADYRALVLLVPEGVTNGARGTVLGAMSAAAANVALRFFITATREVLVGSAVFTLRGEKSEILRFGC